MDPERWRFIEKLYHAALERDADARAALLAAADPEIRREVETLLAQKSVKGVLDLPVAEAARELGLLSLAPGARLGPYRIDARAGTGGDENCSAFTCLCPHRIGTFCLSDLKLFPHLQGVIHLYERMTALNQQYRASLDALNHQPIGTILN